MVGGIRSFAMSSALSSPHLQNEEAAYAYVEARVWPEGPICPHCGCMGRIYAVAANGASKVRIGLKKCGDCRKQFTVKVGTVFESSHVPLRLWLQAVALLTASKKGISSNQLHRTLGVTLKTAWFMSHRIREAMRSGDLAPFGGGGGAVEVDETFWGTDTTRVNKGKRRAAHMNKVMSLIDRDSGQARSIVVEDLKLATVAAVVSENIAIEARLMTDEAYHYVPVGKQFAEHGSVNHKAEEYVSLDDPTIHTNTVEGYFSIFKRGMRGIYQHCAKKHLHRYMAEYDFRYSNRIALGVDDDERAERALKGIVGKRLTYRTTSGRGAAAEATV
jgi:transposase-like protein